MVQLNFKGPNKAKIKCHLFLYVCTLLTSQALSIYVFNSVKKVSLTVVRGNNVCIEKKNSIGFLLNLFSFSALTNSSSDILWVKHGEKVKCIVQIFFIIESNQKNRSILITYVCFGINRYVLECTLLENADVTNTAISRCTNEAMNMCNTYELI